MDFKIKNYNTRDFIPVECVARMFLDGLESQDINNGNYVIKNIGSRVAFKIKNWVGK